MNIDLAKIQDAAFLFDVEIPAENIDLEGENINLKGPVKTIGQITRNGEKFDTIGTIEAEAEIACTRCLEPVEAPVAIDLNVVYVRVDDRAEQHTAELQTEDLDTDLLPGDTLDMAELVREQILLGIPEQLFCREECKGLCPKCGVNLNLIDCNCTESETDPRWEVLKNLK